MFQAKKFSHRSIFELYGISQDPDTKNYIVVLQDIYCEKCGKKYMDIRNYWCNPCEINHLKNNFDNWTSGNKKIDDFIQKGQLKINNHDDIIFEWIPYNQFNKIKKIDKYGFITVYSAIWKDGPLRYNKYKYIRDSNNEVALKCLHNSQNQNPVEFLINEVQISINIFYFFFKKNILISIYVLG